MKKTIFKLTFFLFLIPFISFGNDNKKKHEKSKTIRKEFVVNKDAKVFINNKYGNVNVTTWNENRVTIDVKITVKGSDLEQVERKLNTINVNFNASSSLVEAQTVFEKVKSSWSFWGKNKNTSYQINYFVKMPVTNSANLKNKYGNISLDEIQAKCVIDCKYGNIDLGQLLNKTNDIKLAYGKSTINYIKAGRINIDYSKCKIEEADVLKVNTDYSNLDFGKVRDIDFNADYGSITIDEVENINGNADFTGMRFGTVKKNIIVDTDYGGLRIKNLENGFEKVIINGSYAGIKIGTNSANNFNFNIDLGYAGFSYSKENVEMLKSIKKTTKKHYEGRWGKQKSTSTIDIKSSYGSVSIKQND